MDPWDITDLMNEQSSESIAIGYWIELTCLIDQKMEKKGISKSELAQNMGIHRSSLSKLLNRYNNMTLETIAKFDKVLGLTERNKNGRSHDQLRRQRQYVSRRHNWFRNRRRRDFC